MTSPHTRAALGAAAGFVLLILCGLFMPDWAMFLTTLAFAKGLVSLGIIALMRAGLVSFGQGLYYCIGAYVAAFMNQALGTSDIVLLSMTALVVSGGVGMLVGPILARYRGIFFAMLPLSLSMILYGTLAKLNVIGGTDGLVVRAPTFLGYAPEGEALSFALFVFTSLMTVIGCLVMRVYFDSERGMILLGIRENELRVEYLGASVRNAIAVTYVLAAALGGLGGLISGVAVGHVSPEHGFWIQSGEFVFIGILSGFYSVGAVFVGAIILEVIRSFSNVYFPLYWQMILGVFLLTVIFLLPNGLGSLMSKKDRERRGT